MNREVWEFLREGKHRVIREWLDDRNISAKDRAKLDFCLERLRTLDFALVSNKLLTGPLRGGTKLYKLRVRCQDKEFRPFDMSWTRRRGARLHVIAGRNRGGRFSAQSSQCGGPGPAEPRGADSKSKMESGVLI